MAKTLLYDKKPRTLVGTGNPGSKHADVAVGTLFIDDAATNGNLIWVKTSPPGSAVWKLIVTTEGLLSSDDGNKYAPVGDAAAKIAAHTTATDPHGDRAWTTSQINALVNSAPGLLDTLGEIAAQLASDETAVGALTTTVNGKLAKSSNLADLTDKNAARANLQLGTSATKNVEQLVADPVFVSTLGRPLPPGRGAVVYILDDGYSDHQTVRTLADARGQRLTFAINSALLDVGGRMTSAQVLSAYQAGHEIANHTVNHTNLGATGSVVTRNTEVDNCQTFLTTLLGTAPRSFVYPNGGRTDQTDQELYTRFDRIRTTSSTGGSLGVSRYAIGDHNAFVIGGQPWSISHDWVLDSIKQAAYSDTITVIYSHAFGPGAPTGEPNLAQITEALDLAKSLRVPLITMAEAFPGHVLLRDPGFETYPLTGLVAWNAFVSGSGIAEITNDTPDVGLTGSKSLHLSVPTGTGFSYAQQTVATLPNRTYTISGRARVSGTPGTAVQVRIRQRDYQGNILGSPAPTYTTALTSTTWTRFTVDVTTAQNSNALIIEPIVNAVAAEAWFDHLHVGPKNFGAFG